MTQKNSINENNLPNLKEALSQQAVHTPPAFIRARVMAEIQELPQRMQSPRWAIGAVLSLIILAILWGIVQPGIVLQWAWKNGDVETFRVYRAAEGSVDFSLLSEISTKKTATEYTFVDSTLIPGQNYTYKIQAVNNDGQLVFSELVSDSGISALPGQLALIITSLVIAYGLINLRSIQHLGKLNHSV
jgi:fibronectin type 3 domain-containing protein